MATGIVAPPRELELFPTPGDEARLALTGRRADALAKMGVATVQDLVQHYPRYHVDRTQLRTIAEVSQLVREGHEREVQVHASVVSISRPIRTRTGKRMITGKIGDETGTLPVTWFNQEWVARALRTGVEAFFFGRLQMWRGRLQMMAPRFELVRTGKEPFNVGRIIPIYPASAEMSSDQLRKLIWDALQRVPGVLDPLPESLGRALGLMSRGEAIRLIHFPESKQDVLQARRRLVFDEVFTLQLGLVYRKRKLERTVTGIPHVPPGESSLAAEFIAGLPFKLTSAQERACVDVVADMARSSPMHRLLEGEVGSGKTVVAVYACLVAIEGGHQAAFMAPTEVLAEQHYLTIKELLDRAFGSAEARNLFASVSRRPVVRLLTGSTPATQRATLLEEVARGEVDLLIGTHALIQEGVSFSKLGIAIVDEQHRFGVHQRRRLRAKGQTAEPDILVMTATPIPRTLAVTIYGDLDVSILDELPKGRQPIATRLALGERDRDAAYELIREEVARGRQAYVVYALRDESDKLELRSAKAEARRLAEDVFSDLVVGLVHGDMKSQEKEEAMGAFRDGRTQVLVATTVIEVGVDVPNATVMLIEDADRFGLAQLHQLRGRIGRGEHRSHCVLATDIDLAREDDPAVAPIARRLRAIEATLDGFKLALVDLEQRGEGQLFGARQSGMPQLKLARVLEHQDVIQQARDFAVAILDEDPDLSRGDHRPLRREMAARFPPGALDVVQAG